MHPIEGKLENELGYRFDSEVWGRGLATQAAKACSQYAFNKLNLAYILGIVEPENYASIRVLEKIGMEFIKKSTWCGKVIYIYTGLTQRRFVIATETECREA